MLSYIFEFKLWLLLLSFSWFSLLLVSFLYKESLLLLIIYSSEFSYFIFTDARELLEIYLMLFHSINYYICFFYISYHLFTFLTPAFYVKEFRFYKFLLNNLLFTFLIAFTISLNLILPYTWNFFMGFQDLLLNESFNLFLEARLKDYLFFSISFNNKIILCLQIFSLLLAISFWLTSSGLFVKHFRKYYYFCVLLFFTLIIPSEIVSLTLSITFIVGYEFAVFYFLIRKYLSKNIN